MNQIIINGIKGWIGRESGGWGNGPNHYRICFSAECPADEILRYAGDSRESNVVRTWAELPIGFADSYGRKQIVFEAAIAAGISNEAIQQYWITQAISKVWKMDKNQTSAFRRKIEDQIRKRPDALIELAEKIDWIRDLI